YRPGALSQRNPSRRTAGNRRPKDLAGSPGALGSEWSGADGNDPNGVGGLVARLAFLSAVRLRHDAGPGQPRQSTVSLLHLFRRAAQGLAHLSVEVAARRGHRTLRPRTDRLLYAGQPSPRTTADNYRPASTSARLRSAHRVRRHDRRNGHDFEGPVLCLEGKRMNTPTIL